MLKTNTIFTCSNNSEKKKWYDQNCYSKKQKLQECIRNFNLSKTQENRTKVFDARKDYKYYCRKCKQNFNRNRCNQINEMRRKKPKEFRKKFKQKKIGQKTNLTENDFYEYFKNLSAEITDNSPEEVGDFLYNFDLHDRNSTFPELDEQISKEEILKAIKFLKINKSSGNDDILNDYFHKAAEILIEQLHIFVQ